MTLPASTERTRMAGGGRPVLACSSSSRSLTNVSKRPMMSAYATWNVSVNSTIVPGRQGTASGGSVSKHADMHAHCRQHHQGISASWHSPR